MIPYVRQPNYLSPSALHQVENDPLEFYLRRLGPKETAPPRSPQTFPMAVGTVFDAYVKNMIAAQIRIDCPPAKEMLQRSLTITPTAEWERAVKMGYQLAIAYERCGAFEAILKENVVAVERHTDIGHTPGDSVPIFGEIDCVIQPDPKRPPVVLDWKVTGSGRPGTMSPNPGYDQILSTVSPPRGPHKRAGECMGALNRGWGTQLAMYTWLLRESENLRLARVAIDQIVVGKDGNIRVARFRGCVSSEFQREVRQRLVMAWAAIMQERVVPPEIADMGYSYVEALA